MWFKIDLCLNILNWPTYTTFKRKLCIQKLLKVPTDFQINIDLKTIPNQTNSGVTMDREWMWTSDLKIPQSYFRHTAVLFIFEMQKKKYIGLGALWVCPVKLHPWWALSIAVQLQCIKTFDFHACACGMYSS